MKRLILSLILLASCVSCTDNNRARNFGGTETVNVTPGSKVINATWKETDLWVLTRPMRPDEKPETLKFVEKSSFGVWEGTIILKESKEESK